MSAGPPEPGAPPGPAGPEARAVAADRQDPTAEPAGESAAEPATEPAGEPAEPGPGLHWRTSLLLVSAFLTVLLASVTMLLPVPYVVLEPGPAINTLGQDDGHDLISVRGRTTYPAKGSLDLTTVTVRGGPGSRLSVYQVLGGWFDRERAVVPLDVVYPPGQTVESSRAENQEEMISSQEAATVAALRELDIPIPTTLTVHSVEPGTPASPLRAGDVLLALNGRTITGLEELNDLMKGVEAGSTVRVTVRRNGGETVVEAPTRRLDGGRTILGITVDPTFRPPFEVTIRIGNVGGPSAGLMFALGIVDVLTPGDLTGGKHIAGTGTITHTGEIGAIGGIAQKLVGARDAGARWFLAPQDNCGAVSGHVPEGLRVVPVAKLDDAREAVDRIAADGDRASLPSCS